MDPVSTCALNEDNKTGRMSPITLSLRKWK